MALNKIQLLALIDDLYQTGVSGNITSAKIRQGLREVVEFADEGNFEDIDFEYDPEATYNTTTKKYAEAHGRLYKSKREGNTGNIPPDEPDPESDNYENFWWVEISKNDGLIQIYKPGLFGTGKVIVYYDYDEGSKIDWVGVKFWELAVPEGERPFESTDISAEIEAVDNEDAPAPKWVPAQQIPQVPQLPNMVLEGLSLHQTGSDIEVQPGKWLIDQINYETTDPVEITLSPIDEGYERIDVIVAKNDNEIAVVEGIPKDLSNNAENTVKPSIPAGSIEIGFAIVGAEVQVQAVGLYESLSYSDAKVKKDSNGLTEGQYYKITDYRTRQYIEGVGLNDGPIEPIVLLATSKNTFRSEVFSTVHLFDKIEYDFDDDVCEDQSTSRPGRITSRIDTIKNIGTLAYDFRVVQYRMFNIIGFQHDLGQKSSDDLMTSMSSRTVISDMDAVHWHLIDFTNFTTHNANPSISIKNTDAKEMIKENGDSFSANELGSYLPQRKALLMYSPSKDAYYVINSNSLNSKLSGAKWIDWHLEIAGYTLELDFEDELHYTFGSSDGGSIRGVIIPKTSEKVYNSVIFTNPSSNIKDMTIGTGCYDIVFCGNNYVGMDIKTANKAIFSGGFVGDQARIPQMSNTMILGSFGTLIANSNIRNSLLYCASAHYQCTLDFLLDTTLMLTHQTARSHWGSLQNCFHYANSSSVFIQGKLTSFAWEPGANFQNVFIGYSEWVNESFTEPKTNVALFKDIEADNLPDGSGTGLTPAQAAVIESVGDASTLNTASKILVDAINEVLAAVGGVGALTADDIDTLAELNAILNDADVASQTFVTALINAIDAEIAALEQDMLAANQDIQANEDAIEVLQKEYVVDIDFEDLENFTFKAPEALIISSVESEPGTTPIITGYTVGDPLAKYSTFTISVDEPGMVTLRGVIQ